MVKAKFSTTLLVLLGILLVMPILAAASSITESSVLIHADYSKFTKDNDDTISVITDQFTVVNDGASPLTVKATGLPSKYSSDTVTVPGMTTQTVTLSIEVPHRKSPGTEKIGSITITDGTTVLDTADLNQETAIMMEFSKFEVKYVDATGKSRKDEIPNDENSYSLEKEVRPYTQLTINFNVQNLFDRDYNNRGQLENSELVVDSSDSDLLPSDFKDTYEFENIEAGKEGKFILPISISKDVSPDTYTLKFNFTAVDGKGIEYQIKKEVEVQIELGDQDVRVIKAQLMPETITACDTQASLQVAIHNFGYNDQKRVAVSVLNEELNIDQIVSDIKLDAHTQDNNEWQKTFTFPLANLKEKSYALQVRTFVDNVNQKDLQVVPLDIKSCAASSAPEQNTANQEPNPVTQQPQKETPNNTASQALDSNTIQSVEKISYNSSDYLVALMLIAIAVVAVLVVMMSVILFKS